DIAHQTLARKRTPLFNERMLEFDRDMERIARAAAVAHHEQLSSLEETASHQLAHICEPRGMLFEELQLHIDAFADFTKNRFARIHALIPAPCRLYAKYAAHAPSEETMVAPSGCSGVHSLPNAGHSCGFLTPFRTRPLIQSADSCVSISSTSKMRSAS